jgi:peptidoglycan biosynthesis protein MviN/MurJ (putative lipid II flippase)
MLVGGASGLPAATKALASAALPGLVLVLPILMLTALQSAWMMSSGRHLNTLLECIPALFIAALVLTVSGPGIQPLVWGTVAGCACQLLALLAPMVRRREIEMPSFRLASPQWAWFWQGFGIMLAGQALLSLTTVIDQFYAVGLGTGAIATLGYANRILSLILSLAAIAATRATLPVFSQAGKRDAAFRELAAYWTRLMFLAGLAVTLACHLLAPWAVKLLFERGQFSAADTAIVAEVLRYGLPQLPFYFAAMVLVSYALSQRRYGLIFWSGVIGFAGKVAGNLLLVPPLGVNGIALAAMFVYALNAAFFWFALIKPVHASTRWFN